MLNMRFVVFVATSLAMLASARPQGTDPAYAAAQAQCGNDATISCCNKSDQITNTQDSTGILPVQVNQFLAGNCQQLNVPGKLGVRTSVARLIILYSRCRTGSLQSSLWQQRSCLLRYYTKCKMSFPGVYYGLAEFDILY